MITGKRKLRYQLRITVMKQMLKGFREDIQGRFDKQLESIKWNIWYGNVEKALTRIESFCDDIEYDEQDKQNKPHEFGEMGWYILWVY